MSALVASRLDEEGTEEFLKTFEKVEHDIGGDYDPNSSDSSKEKFDVHGKMEDTVKAGSNTTGDVEAGAAENIQSSVVSA